MAYEIVYSPDAVNHLADLHRREQTIVLDTVEKRLRHEPGIESRNRKRMRPNPVVPWELRIVAIRVYYDVARSPAEIGAIGVKDRNAVRIGGEVIEL